MYKNPAEINVEAVSNFLDEEVMNNFVAFFRRFYSEDIFFLMSFPRSGNGWIRYLITEALLISKGIELKGSKRGTYEYNNITAHCIVTKSGDSFGIEDYFPDYYAINKVNFKRKYIENEHPILNNAYIKTHHLVSRKDVKIVHLYRHPRDVCMSLFSFKNLNNKSIQFDKNNPEFVHFFKQSIQIYLDAYYKILGFYSINENNNILLLRMEDMTSSSAASFDVLLDFLNIHIPNRRKAEILDRNPKLPTINRTTWMDMNSLWDEELDSYAKSCMDLYASNDKFNLVLAKEDTA